MAYLSAKWLYSCKVIHILWAYPREARGPPSDILLTSLPQLPSHSILWRGRFPSVLFSTCSSSYWLSSQFCRLLSKQMCMLIPEEPGERLLPQCCFLFILVIALSFLSSRSALNFSYSTSHAALHCSYLSLLYSSLEACAELLKGSDHFSFILVSPQHLTQCHISRKLCS